MTLARGVSPLDHSDPCFNVEAFCSLMCETPLEAATPAEFVQQATEFCNDVLWGTLCATIVASRESLNDPVTGAAIEQAIADLRYGSIGVNVWHALSFALAQTTWGAYPGHVRSDIQSGSGVVGNSFMFVDPQKSVVRGPFVSRPKPAWFVTQLQPKLARLAMQCEATPTWRSVGRVLAAALKK